MIIVPKTMKAVQGKGYGNIDEMLTVEDGVATPTLQDEYNPVKGTIHPIMQYAAKEDRKSHMIIKTLAVSLAPGDVRVLSGKTSYFQGPPSFPYIPGGDCCGIVVETCPNDTTGYFQVGDVVAARFTNVPRDGLSEYSRVSINVCDKLNNNDDGDDTSTCNISPVEAAALVSASPAVCINEYLRDGERVLILGGTGGVGSHLCQLAKNVSNVSYLCCTASTAAVTSSSDHNNEKKKKEEEDNSSSNSSFLHYYDDIIDYTKQSVYENSKYQNEPFDTIIDLSSGGWPALQQSARSCMPSIIKNANNGGRFITITSDTPSLGAHNNIIGGKQSFVKLLGIVLFQPLWRYIYTRFNPLSRRKLPTFTNVMALPDTRDVITKTLNFAKDGKLKAIMNGPYPMTTNGIRNAFHRLESRHPKYGKVVIQVSDKVPETKQ